MQSRNCDGQNENAPGIGAFAGARKYFKESPYMTQIQNTKNNLDCQLKIPEAIIAEIEKFHFEFWDSILKQKNPRNLNARHEAIKFLWRFTEKFGDWQCEQMLPIFLQIKKAYRFHRWIAGGMI